MTSPCGRELPASEQAELGALLVECLTTIAEAASEREQQSPAGEPYRCDEIACTDHPGDDPQAVAGPEQADRWAAEARAHWAAGRLAQAAAYNHACRHVDPDRAELWQARSVRLLEAASRKSLAEQNAVRLAVAGIGPDDPGVQQITANNESARAQAPARTQADREAAQ